MNKKQQEQIVNWLRSAYTMERSVSQVLGRELDDFPQNPEMVSQLKAHIEESQMQAEKLKGRITELGGSVGGGVADIESRIAGAFGNVQDMIAGGGEAKAVRETIANFATENLEVGTYQALAVAAEEVGDTETAQLAKSILSDEQKSAQAASQFIPQVVKTYVGKLK